MNKNNLVLSFLFAGICLAAIHVFDVFYMIAAEKPPTLRIHLIGEDGKDYPVDIPQFSPATIDGKVTEPVCIVPGLKKIK